MSVQGLERLEVWRKAKEFALAVYREALPQFPVEETRKHPRSIITTHHSLLSILHSLLSDSKGVP